MGVFLKISASILTPASLPHARGGVSWLAGYGGFQRRSSPRTWGCFPKLAKFKKSVCVFPTHVGVFLRGWSPREVGNCLPHARGGVSPLAEKGGYKRQSSPRTWGCFLSKMEAISYPWVFPTHVGVFPWDDKARAWTVSLPHARGGVSYEYSSFTTCRGSSPRTWGCFQVSAQVRSAYRVFPTHVGVFLKWILCKLNNQRLPHARGGVSYWRGMVFRTIPSSPRTWGCFPARGNLMGQLIVFPTHVGVFPRLIEPSVCSSGLPHARGGVSCEGSTSIGVLESSLHMWDLAISGILVLE